MKGDSRLCQPAGTPIIVQTGRRLGVTLIDVETDVLRPVHISVERIVGFLIHVQAAFNTLTLVFSPAHTTRLTRVPFWNFSDIDTFDFCLVVEDIGEAVKRPTVQVEVAVPTPVLRVAVFILSNTSEFADVDLANSTLDTLLNDAFGETVEEVGAALRPL